ncbi:hypothetical protein [Sphingomonas bacterium]|uniref:hypothetical protein n=1 Tax=Sphingomonas bacterium TaxID=1895847 RepID=UPI0015763663|nr:hypothetical protein [Sphingomonas bacterium]
MPTPKLAPAPAADGPATGTGHPDPSTELQRDGDARHPSEHLDKGQQSRETIPRKSSLLGD